MAQLQKLIRPALKAARFLETTNSTSHDGHAEYTVEQLAATANITVRTVRNYQDKGLLDSPKLKGRKGFYSAKHLARLKLIASLLERGFTVIAIRDMLSAKESGIGFQEFLGAESALTSPWSDEEPQVISLPELYAMFSGFLTPEALVKAQDLGLFSIKGAAVTVNSMQILEVGQTLAATGIPLIRLMQVLENVQSNVQEIANNFVQLVTTHVLEPYGELPLPPKEALPQLTELVWELRPLAEKVVSAALSKAMAESANNFLADKLADLLSKNQSVINNQSTNKKSSK